MDSENFTREELQILITRAFSLSEVEGTNPYWADAYRQLAIACDRVDAYIARSTLS